MGFDIRRVGPGDEPLFERVAPEVFDEPINAERLRAYLAEPGHLMLLALSDDEVVGQCAAVLHHHPDKATELYIDEVGVASAHLRRGIATSMVRAMFEWGRELGCDEAWLGTELDNLEANGLYRKVGGTPEHMHYYEFKL